MNTVFNLEVSSVLATLYDGDRTIGEQQQFGIRNCTLMITYAFEGAILGSTFVTVQRTQGDITRTELVTQMKTAPTFRVQSIPTTFFPSSCAFQDKICSHVYCA
jgi:hypothetical protein